MTPGNPLVWRSTIIEAACWRQNGDKIILHTIRRAGDHLVLAGAIRLQVGNKLAQAVEIARLVRADVL